MKMNWANTFLSNFGREPPMEFASLIDGMEIVTVGLTIHLDGVPEVRIVEWHTETKNETITFDGGYLDMQISKADKDGVPLILIWSTEESREVQMWSCDELGYETLDPSDLKGEFWGNPAERSIK